MRAALSRRHHFGSDTGFNSIYFYLCISSLDGARFVPFPSVFFLARLGVVFVGVSATRLKEARAVPSRYESLDITLRAPGFVQLWRRLFQGERFPRGGVIATGSSL